MAYVYMRGLLCGICQDEGLTVAYVTISSCGVYSGLCQGEGLTVAYVQVRGFLCDWSIKLKQ